MQNTEKRYVGVKETILYGVANGGQVIGYNLVRQQFTFFYVTVFGIPGPAVSLMIALIGVWDALNDPMMGSIVDRTRTRYGKLRPYLLFVPLPLAITTILLFGGAQFLSGVQSTTAKIVYMYITYILWEFFYTIGDIPFWGLSAALSPNPRDRSAAITSARFISSIIGGVTTAAIPVFIDLSRNQIIPWNMKQIFFFMGCLAGTVGMGLFSLSGICTTERVIQPNDDPRLLDGFRYLFKNKPLLLIVLSNILGTVGGIGDVFTQYFYTFSLGIASLSLLAGIPGTVTGFLSYLFIPKIEKKLSSKQIIIVCGVGKVLVTALIFLIGIRSYTNKLVIVPLLAIQGIFTSAISSLNMVIPTKMVGDTVDYMEWKTGDRSEATTFSLLTFVGKLTASFSNAIATLIIPLIGLHQVNDQMVLTESSTVNTRFWLWALITVIPPILGLVSLIPYAFYDLDGKKLSEIQAELARRREERNKAMTAKQNMSELEPNT